VPTLTKILVFSIVKAVKTVAHMPNNRIFTFHYQLFDSNSGVLLENSEERGEPAHFNEGTGEIMPGLEVVLIQMTPGEKRTVNLPCAQAFGIRREDMIFKVPRENFESGDSDKPLKPGEWVHAREEHLALQILEVDAEFVTLDGNPPLAGKDLRFEVELVEIKEVTKFPL